MYYKNSTVIQRCSIFLGGLNDVLNEIGKPREKNRYHRLVFSRKIFSHPKVQVNVILVVSAYINNVTRKDLKYRTNIYLTKIMLH